MPTELQTQDGSLPTVNMFDFDRLMDEVVQRVSDLKRYFELNFIYYQLVSGRGLEFDKIRQYIPGDNVHSIDWKIFAKHKELFTKVYREERQFDIILVVDVSETMLLGSTDWTKSEYAAVLAGTLAYAAVECQDLVAVVMISDGKLIATNLESDYARLVHQLSLKENYGGGKAWDKVLLTLMGNYSERSIIFLLSDFIDFDAEKYLPDLATNFAKVYGVMIRDPLDEELPENVGNVYLRSLNSKRARLINCDQAREEYKMLTKQQISKIKDVFHDYDQLLFKINTKEEFSAAFVEAVGEEKVEVL